MYAAKLLFLQAPKRILGASGRLLVVQDASKTFQTVANTVARTSDAFKDIIEVHSFEARLLNDVHSQITVFACSKTYLGGFRTPVRWLKDASNRCKCGFAGNSHALKDVIDVYRFEA